jgi:putative intracellular protease/amidase
VCNAFFLCIIAGKLRAAVAVPGGEQSLVSLLHALSQLPVRAPSEVLIEALTQLQTAVDRLTAVEISGVMTALKKLQMDPDDQLMGSYLDRAAAAAAAGTASAKDMAAVLQSLAAAGVVPSGVWLGGFLVAVQQKLADADSQTLAAICHAAAALTEAGQAGAAKDSSSSYSPDPRFVSDLAAEATSRLGSSYMDASRILNSPDYKAPLNLSGLADAAWGLVQLGANPKDLQPLINMLISKSYDRFSQLTVQQLCGAAWAIARCSSSSSNAAAVKLPSKWLNQFAAAAAPGVQQLTKPQLSELIWALGRLYLSADGQYSTGSGSSSSSSSSSNEGSSNSSSSSTTAAGSSIGRSSDVPVQQLLRTVASQLDTQLLEQQQQQGPGQTEVSTMVNLLTKFDCSASRLLLQRFCADVSGAWPQLSDAAVADAAVAVAVLVEPGSSSSSIVPPGWMQTLADQVHSR